MGDDLEGAIVAYFKLLSLNSSVETEENHGKPPSSEPVIEISYLPNKSLGRYRYTNLLDKIESIGIWEVMATIRNFDKQFLKGKMTIAELHLFDSGT
jgi:hypothetical protein